MTKTPRLLVAKAVSGQLDRSSAKKLSREVAAYLLNENRIGELDSLLRDIMQLRADKDGVVELKAVAAYPLTETVRRDIKARVKDIYPKARQVIIDEQIHPEVVGGIKIELAHEQLDLSIRYQLNKFKQYITAKQ